MSEANSRLNSQAAHPKMSINIEDHMQTRRQATERLHMGSLQKLKPYTWIVLTDPKQGPNSWCFGIVNFDKISFSIFEKSMQEIEVEKDINISPKLLANIYQIKVISEEEMQAVMTDEHIGGVYVKLHKKIRDISKKKHGVDIDSALTTLNGMLLLHLIPSENSAGYTLNQCKKLAQEITDHSIKNAAWLALRKREAVYMVEREIIAIKG